ncbi:hypothetical protein GCM10018785_47210 [Streptomyces longispororuber]|uniref:Uncharacterized protein n=1 Tax=Streptomyces longispororuber TaxID=68230 RepID=A0A918ZXS6_9ACTN|nr:hypothetical protein GCM10018785_47210 [Streptomyces longispororuber]
MGSWTPVVYRGDGAWIGVMPDGRIGVGVESEGRSSLEGSGFVPMWPFLERDLSTCLATFSGSWERLGQGGVRTPERLVELTVETAWKSGRSYWMELAAIWAIEMVGRKEFDHEATRVLLREMAMSEALTPELREQARGAGD